ncbi:MAG: hypothetical protein U0165_18670 [Polyangiaceae bacterium]
MSDFTGTTTVFSQSPTIQPDEHALIVQARKHFDAGLVFTTRKLMGSGAQERAEYIIDITLDKQIETHRLETRIRRAAQDDWDIAARAEILGKAGGMSTLAKRCNVVWEIAPCDSERALLTFCATLTIVALGPVMPPSCDTLFGTRGARERLERSLR